MFASCVFILFVSLVYKLVWGILSADNCHKSICYLCRRRWWCGGVYMVSPPPSTRPLVEGLMALTRDWCSFAFLGAGGGGGGGGGIPHIYAPPSPSLRVPPSPNTLMVLLREWCSFACSGGGVGVGEDLLRPLLRPLLPALLPPPFKSQGADWC